MPDIKTLLILIPGLPLAAALLTAALGPRVLRARSHLPTVAALALSFVASMLLVFRVQERIERWAAESSPPRSIGYEDRDAMVTLWRWVDISGPLSLRERVRVRAASSDTGTATSLDGRSPHPLPLSQRERGEEPPFRIDVTLRADPLTAVMLAIVTCISTLVAIYAIGYMHGDPGYWRFFAYVSLFVFSMTMLVSASNFLLLYVFWEAVGLCSYLLIGFWYEKPAAAAAGKKAFLVNRIGDVGFSLAIFLIWTTYGTLNFHDTVVDGHVVNAGVLGQSRLALEAFVGDWRGTAICLLLLLGACGKSASSRCTCGCRTRWKAPRR